MRCAAVRPLVMLGGVQTVPFGLVLIGTAFGRAIWLCRIAGEPLRPTRSQMEPSLHLPTAGCPPDRAPSAS